MCPMLCLFPDPGCPVNGGFTGWVCCLTQLYQWMVIHFLQGSLLRKNVKVLVTQSCLTLYNPIDYSPPGSSVHGILQTRIVKWVAIPFSRGFSQSRYWTKPSQDVTVEAASSITHRLRTGPLPRGPAVGSRDVHGHPPWGAFTPDPHFLSGAGASLLPAQGRAPPTSRKARCQPPRGECDIPLNGACCFTARLWKTSKT